MNSKMKLRLESLSIHSFVTALGTPQSLALNGGSIPTLSLHAGINCGTNTGTGGVSDASMCCEQHTDVP